MTREEELKKEYECKLAALRTEQNSCNHIWEEVKFDPETSYEPIYENEWYGVDCIPVIVGSRPIEKNRWSRTCKKCGKVEYTYERVPIKYEPVFK